MVSKGLAAVSFGTPRPTCAHGLCRGSVFTNRSVSCSRRALQHRQRSLAHLKPVSRSISNSASSSLPADAKEVVENAIPGLGEDKKSSRWAHNQQDLRKLLHNTWCSTRKKLWVAALALYYLYNEAAAKVPWLKLKKFEAWFWKQVRCTWLPAASAATVLARQYFKDAWFVPGNLLQRKDVLEAEVKASAEQVTQDVEENLEEQREAVRQRLPDAVNPLLLGQNLRERLDSGALDLPTFEAAMAELKQAVPFLNSGKDNEAVEAELEAQTRDGERDAAASHTSVAGFLNLPLASSLGGPQPLHGDPKADGKAAVGEAEQEVGRKWPGWPVLGFLSGSSGALSGSSKGNAKAVATEEKAVKEQEEERFSWDFLKKSPFSSQASADAQKAEAAAAEAKAAEEREGRISWAFLKKTPFSSQEGSAKEGAEGSVPEADNREWKGLSLPFLGQGTEEAQAKAAEEEAEEDRGFVLGFLQQNLLGQSSEESEQKAHLANQEAVAAKDEKSEGGILGFLQKGKRTPDKDSSAAEEAETKESKEEAKGLLSNLLDLG